MLLFTGDRLIADGGGGDGAATILDGSLRRPQSGHLSASSGIWFPHCLQVIKAMTFLRYLRRELDLAHFGHHAEFEV